MSRVLPRLFSCLACGLTLGLALLLIAGEAVAGRGGIGIGWLAPEGPRGVAGGAARDTWDAPGEAPRDPDIAPDANKGPAFPLSALSPRVPDPLPPPAALPAPGIADTRAAQPLIPGLAARPPPDIAHTDAPAMPPPADPVPAGAALAGVALASLGFPDPGVEDSRTGPDAEAARHAALGAAFNADLLARRRARVEGLQDGTRWTQRFSGQGVAGLRDLIASVEAGKKGYDAIHLSARNLPARPPTELTIAEIDAWVRATPGQQHAIGRYQFIPKTLAMLVGRLGVAPTSRFTPALQDRLADELLADAGLAEFTAGRIPRAAFMANLARIWAGLPVESGKSYYHGLAGNAAGMSWAAYDRHMAALFPSPLDLAAAAKPAR